MKRNMMSVVLSAAFILMVVAAFAGTQGTATNSGGCAMMKSGSGASCPMMGGKAAGSCPAMGMAATRSKTAHAKAAPGRKSAKVVSAVCPVMGTKIPNVTKAAGKSVYKGKTYYFCCPGCKPQFDKNPAKYAGKTAPTHK